MIQLILLHLKENTQVEKEKNISQKQKLNLKVNIKMELNGMEQDMNPLIIKFMKLKMEKDI